MTVENVIAELWLDNHGSLETGLRQGGLHSFGEPHVYKANIVWMYRPKSGVDYYLAKPHPGVLRSIGRICDRFWEEVREVNIKVHAYRLRVNVPRAIRSFLDIMTGSDEWMSQKNASSERFPEKEGDLEKIASCERYEEVTNKRGEASKRPEALKMDTDLV